MKTRLLFIIAFLISYGGWSQFQFSGYVDESFLEGKVYLSVVEDYRKMSGVYSEQILMQTQPDSTGFFQFSGNNLPKENKIYRIHVDTCKEKFFAFNHFSGHCPNSKEFLFIANNEDQLTLPFGFENEMFCSVISQQERSQAFLKIDSIKNDMKYAFSTYRSEANRKLNTKKWFTTLQNYGELLNEPLAELYIYSFLSDRSSELYSHYLEDLKSNSYYDNLMVRLEEKYPQTPYIEQYRAEITADKVLIDMPKQVPWWMYALGAVCLLSLAGNYFFFGKWKKLEKEKLIAASLSNQEKKVMHLILEDKSNKEIAETLFVSVSTIKTHINNLYKKLKVNSRDELKSLNIK